MNTAQMYELAKQGAIVPTTRMSSGLDDTWKDASQFPFLQSVFARTISEQHARVIHATGAAIIQESQAAKAANDLADIGKVPANALLNDIIRNLQVNGIYLQRLCFYLGTLLMITLGILGFLVLSAMLGFMTSDIQPR